MLRKDDPAFKKVVDAATAALYTSGEGQKIYDKWFMQKIPPKGLNLNTPIGAGAEARVRQAVGFAGSGFLQVSDVDHVRSDHAGTLTQSGPAIAWTPIVSMRRVSQRRRHVNYQLELAHLLRADARTGPAPISTCCCRGWC